MVVQKAYKYQKNNTLWNSGQFVRTNSICPCYFFYEKGRRRKRGLRIETRTCYPRSYNLAPEKLWFST